MLHDDRCEKDHPKIIDIGFCSLHVLHGVFKSGVEATDLSRKGGFHLGGGFNPSRNYILGLKVSLQANKNVLVLF